MGKFDGVLLASDFDDTLYGLDRQVCPRNRKALNYFIAQGGRFTVATGRAHTTFAPYAHLDYDEANACGFQKGDFGRILP